MIRYACVSPENFAGNGWVTIVVSLLQTSADYTTLGRDRQTNPKKSSVYPWHNPCLALALGSDAKQKKIIRVSVP